MRGRGLERVSWEDVNLSRDVIFKSLTDPLRKRGQGEYRVSKFALKFDKKSFTHGQIEEIVGVIEGQIAALPNRVERDLVLSELADERSGDLYLFCLYPIRMFPETAIERLSNALSKSSLELKALNVQINSPSLLVF